MYPGPNKINYLMTSARFSGCDPNMRVAGDRVAWRSRTDVVDILDDGWLFWFGLFLFLSAL